MLEPGKPCQLGVRSLGSGSWRWFGLNRYCDVEIIAFAKWLSVLVFL